MQALSLDRGFDGRFYPDGIAPFWATANQKIVSGTVYDTQEELIVAAYRVLLGREPEDLAVEQKVAALETPEAVLHDFVGSEEYAYRVGNSRPAREALIRAAYRALLLREPEEFAAEKKAEQAIPLEAILDAFVKSPEFRDRFAKSQELARVGIWEPPLRVDVDVSEAQLQALFDRVQRQWSKLGDTEPYWSVLTQDAFKRESFEQNRAAFFESGARDASLLDLFAKRANVKVPGGTCLELGCGVGRLTRVLADRFEKVIAVDVSEGNLALCRHHLEEAGKHNVECRQLVGLADLEALPEFDVLFSLIVLQHNPPPIIKYVLSQLLPRTNRGGMALFQVPTNPITYSFDIEKYLESPVPELEMHALPMREVFALFLKFGFRPLEALLDDLTGQYGSYTFFAVREGFGPLP
ncbi:MAG TPA: class I SAM-dependent methyltransferase [Rhizomicrobium sp.]